MAMKKELVLLLLEHKYPAAILSVISSVALEKFILEYDWGYAIFGLVGFVVGWAISQVDNKDDDTHKGVFYWIGKVILSLILPVFFTDSVALKTGFDVIVVSMTIGIFPEVILATIKAFSKLKMQDIISLLTKINKKNKGDGEA
mgnify:CR=1 FL=1|jgi:membrane-associated HD superfamily phosphohydrolase